MSTRTSRVVLIVVVPVLAAVWGGRGLLAAGASAEQEYKRQFQALAADDIDGHLKLALWCRDQKAWDLLVQECTHILRYDPHHTQAKLLLKLARSQLGEALPTNEPAAKPEQAGGGAGTRYQPVTDAQMQILRRAELKVDVPEEIGVRLNNKVAERFWTELAKSKTVSPGEREVFDKLSPVQKAQQIIGHVREWNFDPTLAQDVEILSDPQVFDVYIKRVWPIVRTGCATAQCHGGGKGGDLALFNEPTMSPARHYTNFMLLHEYRRKVEQKTDRLIDRDEPEKSLLLVLGSPSEQGSTRSEHQADMPALWRSTADPKYQTVLNWIRQLASPTPDYGFALEPAGPGPSP